MILDINESPTVRSYTYHAFFNAIMDTKKILEILRQRYQFLKAADYIGSK